MRTPLLFTASVAVLLAGAPGQSAAETVAQTAPRAARQAIPHRVVGTGTPASCTSAAFVAAVAKGGRITFDCGDKPVTIKVKRTAKVVNTNKRLVIDGGGKVTLDGAGKRRILYQNTCDAKQTWTTSHCQDQRYPVLVLKRVRFAHGNSTGNKVEGGGGGAVFVRGGQLSIVDSVFRANRCDKHGPDLGGAAVRVLDMWRDRAVTVAGSTFKGGRCSNGGALSSIGVSWDIKTSTFTGNRAVGHGANPKRSGTRGGGSGGAIYLDGNRFTLKLRKVTIEDNRANEGGGAIFFVSNDRTGTMRIVRSTLQRNQSKRFETAGLPGIFFLGRKHTVVDSVLK
ncbi:MAG: hypothetical protein QM655_01735 [Nocardioidaceae bacterium]